MRDLPPLDPTITARAVAAALAVFDDEQGSRAAVVGATAHSDTGADAPVAPVVPLRRRTGWSSALPWLGAAAAAAAVVVGVASLGGRNGDNLADSPAANTQVEAREQSVPEIASAPESGDVTVMSAEDGVGEAAAEDGSWVDDTGRVGEDASSDSVVPMTGTEAPSATPAPSDDELSGSGDTVILEDPAALSAFADSATSIDGVSICAPDTELLTADALFGSDPADSVVVEIVRDEAGDVVAYDIATCSEAARVPRG
jgi:hypothetical protein